MQSRETGAMRYFMALALMVGAAGSPSVFASPAAQIVNPANLVIAGNGTRWEAGVTTARIDIDYHRANAVAASSAGGFDAETTHAVLPFFALSHTYNEQWVLGLAIDMPNYVDIEWGDHTFDVSFAGENLDLMNKGQLKATRLGPSAAVRWNERWSFGARVFVQDMYAMEESDFAKVEGNGIAYGTQLGLRYAGKGYSVGTAYTTRTLTEVTGTQSNIHPALAGSLIAGDARAEILLPARLVTNLAFAVKPDIWGELEVEWFGWSEFNERTIYQADGTISNRGKNLRSYHDIITTRLGMRWQKSPGLSLYGAIGYEPTPIPEEDVSPVSNFLRRTRVTMGAAWKFSEDWRLDTSYQYVRGHSRTVNESTQDSLGGADTDVFEGTYSSTAHALRVSLSGAF